jgi:hypothetical protein
MAFTGGMVARQRQTTAMVPEHILGKAVLKMSLQEVQEFVQTQCIENPALLMDEERRCPSCGGELLGGFCPACGAREHSVDSEPRVPDDNWREQAMSASRRVDAGDDYYEPFATIAAPKSLCDHVKEQAHLILDAEDFPAAEILIDYMDEDDIATLAKSDTVATFVPGANYFLGLEKYPPARELIEAGAAVALATDFNPGTSPTVSMPFVLSLACTHMKMTPAEAIAAATINGAWSIRIADRKGSVEPGKDADLAIFGVKDYREIAYWFATDTCSGVIIGGEPRLKT